MADSSRAGTVYPSRVHEFTTGFYGIPVAQSLVFCVVFCISLFVWTLCCLSFDLRLPITPLVSSNSSYFI
jgi:hypothetical protein